MKGVEEIIRLLANNDGNGLCLLGFDLRHFGF